MQNQKEEKDEEIMGLDEGEEEEAILKLIAMNDVIFEVNMNAMHKASGLIRTTLDISRDVNKRLIPLPLVEADLMEKIISFVTYHYGGRKEIPSEVMKFVDVEETPDADQPGGKKRSYKPQPLPPEGLSVFLDDFDKSFILFDKDPKKNLEFAFRMLYAANYLDMQELVMLLAASIAEKAPKEPEKLYEAFYLERPSIEEEEKLWHSLKKRKIFIYDTPKVEDKAEKDE